MLITEFLFEEPKSWEEYLLLKQDSAKLDQKIVAENKEKGICYICRILDKSEIFNYNKALPLVVKDKGLKEVSVMVVTDKYKSIADAEKHYPKLLGGNNYDN